ncbi:MAG: FkbM family methyltransferase [Chitinophagaceae bacterium]|nr:FkbM family methyltransferase [Chitinophagaceae bacterium]
MNIKKAKKEYRNQEISKRDFIDKMHEFHRVLFDFSENLKDTEIAKIEIQDDKVIFTTRETEYHPGGCKFYVDVVDKRVTPVDTFNFDMYEKDDSKMLFKLIKDGDTIFDIGANIGWYSNHLAKKFPNSVIFSFEPIPETFNQIRANTELNGAMNIKLNNLALSSKKEKLIFYYSPTVTGASSSQNITENQNMTRLELEADSIDNFITTNSIPKLDFVKCDVEGAEYFVYQGGFETFKHHKPIVFTEMLRKWAAKFDYHPNDIINYFAQFGYNCYSVNKGKLKLVDKVDDQTIETNFFFLHKNKHEQIIKEFSKFYGELT